MSPEKKKKIQKQLKMKKKIVGVREGNINILWSATQRLKLK